MASFSWVGVLGVVGGGVSSWIFQLNANVFLYSWEKGWEISAKIMCLIERELARVRTSEEEKKKESQQNIGYSC